MIYFDHNSTTPMHNDVKDVMLNFMEQPLNPSSIHQNGRKAKGIIEDARAQIMELVNIDRKDFNVIFTSGGTESNNLILQNFKNADIFISATEHLSIFALKNYLPNIQVIKVDSNGIINLEDLEYKLKISNNPEKLVSVMLANNETGVIQPIDHVIEISRKYGALVHSDIVQAIGKITVDFRKHDVDFASISGHKFGGPQGTGALLAKYKHNITPILIGGAQEKNLRAGTENVAAIAGFGKAAEIAKKELIARYDIVKNLQGQLEQNLPKSFEIIAKNMARLPNTTLIIAHGFDAQTLLIMCDLQNIMIGSGSACSSGKIGKSHVLEAMGVNANDAKSALRISLSHYNTIEQINNFIKICNELVAVKRNKKIA